MTCKSRNSSATTRATSDRIKSYQLELEGTIQVPLSEKIVKSAFVLDAAHDFKGKSLTIEEFEAGFRSAFGRGFPLLDSSGNIDVSKAEFWVARQLKYNFARLDGQGASISFEKFSSAPNLLSQDQDSATFSYRILAGVVSKSIALKGGIDQPVKKGEDLKVPLNEFETFFVSTKLVSNWRVLHTQTYATDSLQKALKESHEKLELIKKSPEMACYPFDKEYGVYPSALFWYLNFAEHCKELSHLSATLKVLDVKEKTSGDSYPEYARILADGKINTLLYVGSPFETEFDNLEKLIIGANYKKVKEDSSAYTFAKTQTSPSGVSYDYEITIILEKDEPGNASDLFRSRMKDYDILYYGGHVSKSAYSSLFSNAGSYGRGKYQIVYLDACWSYSGMSAENIIALKSTADLDLFSKNVDVIANTQSQSGWDGMGVLILNRMNRILGLFELPGNQWTKKDRDEMSWLGIIKEMHKVARATDDHNNFLVIGEEHNDYQPGEATVKPKNATLVDFIKVADDRCIDGVLAKDQERVICNGKLDWIGRSRIVFRKGQSVRVDSTGIIRSGEILDPIDLPGFPGIKNTFFSCVYDKSIPYVWLEKDSVVISHQQKKISINFEKKYFFHYGKFITANNTEVVHLDRGDQMKFGTFKIILGDPKNPPDQWIRLEVWFSGEVIPASVKVFDENGKKLSVEDASSGPYEFGSNKDGYYLKRISEKIHTRWLESDPL